MNSFASYSRYRRVVFVIAVVCLVTTFARIIFVAASNTQGKTPQAIPVDPSLKAKLAEHFGKLQLSFEANTGQTDKSVKFLSHGLGYELFLTSTEAVLLLQNPRESHEETREGSVLRLNMVGGNTASRIEGQDELPGKVNYFIGNDPEKWRREIPTFRKVYYKDVYPGIDIVYYGNQQELEYDFFVAPGANPKAIKFRIDGADKITLDESGSLLLELKHGEVKLKKPVIYQLTAEGNRKEVKGAYVVNRNEISFKVSGFDSRKPLIIDPILSYATFLGGSGNEQASGIAVDAQGSAYVTGITTFGSFPTTAGAFKQSSASGGAFVTKFDPTGSSLVYSTYLVGNSNIATGTSIAVDSAGNAHVTGFTSASDFPIVNGLTTGSFFYKTTDGAANWNNRNSGLPGQVRAVAVAPSAPNIIYAATPGGPYRSTDGGVTWAKTPLTGFTGFTLPLTIAVDPTNQLIVYVGLSTNGVWRSTDGGNNWSQVNVPLSGAGVTSVVFDPTTPATVYVGSGGGVFKSTDSGTSWTPQNNFAGVSGVPNVRALAIDPTTPATIYAGTSTNAAFYKSTNGGGNWTAMNTGMVNCSAVSAVVIDPFNTATVYAGCGSFGSGGGIQKSTNGATSWGPVNNGVPSNQQVMTILADRTTASTFYAAIAGGGVIKTTNGGAGWTKAINGLNRSDIQSLAADPSNSSIMYAAGAGNDSPEAFVTKLNSSGSGLLFSTFLGGSGDDVGNGIALDATGNIYVAGYTSSTNFPAVNAIQSAPSATEDCTNAFVTKLNPAVPSYVFSTYLGGSKCDRANAIALDGAANVYVTGLTNSTDFPTANAFQATKGDQFNEDAFVTKLSSTGSMGYSTYLGGNAGDTGNGIAVDVSGNAHVTGVTTSTNFPTLNPLQAANGGGSGDVFVTKLNATGSTLLYSTYLGGPDTDFGRGIALDSTGNAYVTGATRSVGFPLAPGSLGTKSPLYKSVDGAANWTNANYGLSSPGIRDIAIHPTQPATMYAATLNGVFKSTNGGKNWSAINNGLPILEINDVVIDPSTPATVYALANDRTFGPNNGIYKSTDGGNSWTLKKTGMTNNFPLSLAIDPSTPAILYVGSLGGPIFKTTNGADNWAPTGAGAPDFAESLAVDPHTPATVFAGSSNSNGGIFRSVDSGATWQSLNVGLLPSINGGVFVSPLTSGLVYANLNAGLFKSVDTGNNWTKIRDVGGKVFFDPVTSSTIYLTSTNEGVLKSTDSGQTWTPMNNGLSFPTASALAIDPVKPSTVFVAGQSGANDDDAFVSKINPAGTTLIYSTLVGGIPRPGDALSFNDTAFAIAVDAAGNAYVAGTSQSTFQQTQNSYQPFNRGFNDAFIAKLATSYVISGHVLDGSSAPVSGADVVLNDGTSITAITTESDGSYEFAYLREGGNFTVSASKPHFTMAPASQTFNNLNSNQTLDFTAAASAGAFHTISGQITNGGVGVANVTVTLSGSQSGLRTTDSNGNYSFELAAGGNYTVTPAILGFTFGPLNQTFNNLSAPQTANFAGTRQSFVVTNANNHGAGSLREAITNANATVGPDTIVFNIPGPGEKVINILNPLPEITDQITIDATTQPGYAGSPLIELDGSGLSSFVISNGLVIKAGGSTIRGLAIGRFHDYGIQLNNCNNNVIQGNHIGIDAVGNLAKPNNTGINLLNSSNNTIGGTTSGARNVISGNQSYGIEVIGNGNVVQGNYIGTNAAGTNSVRNGQAGINLSSNQFANNLIGGTSAGAGNLISGNQTGISINAPGTTVQGNLIGTDVTGTIKVPNATGILSGAANTQIGGLTSAARNIISGNDGAGVQIGGTGSKLQGNYIGTDITGLVALGNGGSGVIAGEHALVGGTTPEARNVIAANATDGGFGNISLESFSTGPNATIQGNYIGTDVTGTKALDPNSTSGISISSNNNLIGGPVPGSPNVISGQLVGIIVGGFISSQVQGNVIQGNLIGLNAQGTGPVPNSQSGIQFLNSLLNFVGGTSVGTANKIAFNGGPGVLVTNNATANSIRGNSIFSNAGLGIDLGTLGVTPNDLTDSDTGGNNLQNFPVLTSVSSSGGSTTIQGTLKSTPNFTFDIDFYTNTALDPSGNGEGALFFGTVQVTANGNGDATINTTITSPLPAGRVITATATSTGGNTSEFSTGDPTAGTGSVQFGSSTFAVIEDVGIANITVTRTGGSTGPLTVDYATTDGTAIAGQDYTAASGTLSFGNGETSKTIQVPITNDANTEPDETFTIALTNAPTLESLGAPVTITVTIQDRTTVPALLAFNGSVTEGDAGTTADVLLEVRMSAATGRTISVNYATANLSAFGGVACGGAGVDYESKSGTLTFQPGVVSIIVPVKVCGDKNAEANETFALNLSNPSNATIADSQGVGTIVNDDVLELLLEPFSPNLGQVAALDALLFVRDPFKVVSIPEMFAVGDDRNTRVILFLRNLELNPGEPSSAVIVRVVGSNNQVFNIQAADVRAVPNFDYTQVVFRLPDNLAPGTTTVIVNAHTRLSNTGTFQVVP
jgi:photosystem II stability/assembly factor-like uncharacterized protein